MMGLFGLPPPLASTLPTVRPRIFVSYHHANDRRYYNGFSQVFHDQYEAIEDRSLDRQCNSDDIDYLRWTVANNDIKGTSCSIVLCGAQTYQRKFVDWEIKATLDSEHGLIGVQLPTAPLNYHGHVMVPTRLAQNIQSGFALWGHWDNLTVDNLRNWVYTARLNAALLKVQIVNPRKIKQRNG
ncbi:MAG TPA: TIR domain-containing protein [Burkholderiales bacterium]|nr:TIR domain-containing protein [Burkholderiales bacterium]